MTNQTTDAIIIGGGIHGTSLAFHLTQRGLKPVVLERKVLAAGATGRSSGLVRMHYDLELEVRLAWASFQYFQNWAELVGGNCGFTRTGFLQIVGPEFNKALRANVAMQQRLGIPTQVITAAEACRLVPILACADFEIAAYEPESGYADPTGTATAFMQAARQRGAELVQECQVTAIEVVGGKVVGVQTNQGNFLAPIVVNTAGPWAAEVSRMVGLDLPLDICRHDTTILHRPPNLGSTHPAIIDQINAIYFRPESGGLTLTGMDDSHLFVQSPDEDLPNRPELVDRTVNRICRHIPGMIHGALHSSYGGYDGMTPDQRAILGQAGPEGFYLACGFSGTGFKTAPAVGACMTELILDGQATTVDISPFGFQRFVEGKLLAGKHTYQKT